MKKDVCKIISVTLSGLAEEEIYKAAYSYINVNQRELYESESNASTYKSKFWNCLDFGYNLLCNRLENPDFKENQKTINLKNDDIQHIDSMTALSDGIFSVLTRRCRYICNPSKKDRDICCYSIFKENGMMLYNYSVLAKTYDYLLFGNLEDVKDIDSYYGEIEFEYWILINNLNNKVINDFNIWNNHM